VIVVLAICCFLQLASSEYINYPYNGRTNKLFIPSNYDPNHPNGYPLFVMLHGCTQDPDQFSRGTKMNELGETHGFLVLYPIQTSASNANKCWNWFDINHQRRGLGEPMFIAGATESVKDKYKINHEHVYVAGLSAGGAMTVIMGVTYPDVFSGIGVAAGLEFKAAVTMMGAFTAMIQGGPAPATQASLAWNAMRNYFKNPLKVLVVQGTSDFTVYPVNSQQVRDSWILTNNYGLTDKISTSPQVTNGQVPGGRAYVTSDYSNSAELLVRHVSVTSMGHAWSGGSSSGSYTDPRGPDMSEMLVKWFLQGNPGDENVISDSNSSF